eukprot:TRINITY_DN2792_c0_g1_i1.p1 TRINITY_DN2792_c0_g1~~TRINITY_DN2792_c0_g1_i1.p1  ORF type:complete len:399 (+),score=138.81 TRINITY_DN2792_c0_g1_i1:70-1197(+)
MGNIASRSGFSSASGDPADLMHEEGVLELEIHDDDEHGRGHHLHRDDSSDESDSDSSSSSSSSSGSEGEEDHEGGDEDEDNPFERSLEGDISRFRSSVPVVVTPTVQSLVNLHKSSVVFVFPPRSEGDHIHLEAAKDEAEEDNDSLRIKGEGGDFSGSPLPTFLEFTLDLLVHSHVTLFFGCREANSKHSIHLEADHVSDPIMVETGYGRKVRTEISEINLEALMSGQSDTLFPLVIETSALDDFVPAALNQAIRHQFTYFHLDMADGHFVLRPIRVKIQYKRRIFNIYDIYGIQNNPNNPGDSNEGEDVECVICMSEIRDTTILPCRHLCLCSGCAEEFRRRSNKCPICRTPTLSLLQMERQPDFQLDMEGMVV